MEMLGRLPRLEPGAEADIKFWLGALSKSKILPREEARLRLQNTAGNTYSYLVKYGKYSYASQCLKIDKKCLI